MNYRKLHPWKVDVKDIFKIQERLRKRIILKEINLRNIKRVAGVDVAFFRDYACAAICIFSFPDLKLIETKTAQLKVSFPYVPGILSFREGPVILKAFKKIKSSPDIILFDGQGICHPRRMGIATHLGVLLDTPSIGCAKTYLYGDFSMPQRLKGAYSLLKDSRTGEVLGCVLRTRTGVSPLFISCGHKITLEQAKWLVLTVSPKFRIPEPLRCAHRQAKADTVCKI